MILFAQVWAQVDPEELANAPANYLLALVLVVTATAFARNWVYLRREVLQRDRRIEQLEREKSEYKKLAFQSVGLTEELVKKELG